MNSKQRASAPNEVRWSVLIFSVTRQQRRPAPSSAFFAKTHGHGAWDRASFADFTCNTRTEAYTVNVPMLPSLESEDHGISKWDCIMTF